MTAGNPPFRKHKEGVPREETERRVLEVTENYGNKFDEDTLSICQGVRPHFYSFWVILRSVITKMLSRYQYWPITTQYFGDNIFFYHYESDLSLSKP